ncbi:MAG: MarR family winged helix-turn-helix transcriptional regulator [Clostridium perfringens]|nr:MarR family winged helix-turn-helix transcriptional regulator [Clostridium perfringens]
MNNKGGFLINKINFTLGRIFNKFINNYKSIDINHAQGRILFIISKYNSLSINDLCKELSVSKSTLTSMLDRLYCKGYISKEVSPLDKRIILISNTEKANKCIEVFNNIVTEMDNTFYKGFTKEEIIQFETYLLKIYSNLESID